MKDFGSIENRARKPTKGIRARLRTKLRQLGVTNKFRTDEHRNGNLIIISRDQFELPITEFEGRQLQFSWRSDK